MSLAVEHQQAAAATAATAAGAAAAREAEYDSVANPLAAEPEPERAGSYLAAELAQIAEPGAGGARPGNRARLRSVGQGILALGVLPAAGARDLGEKLLGPLRATTPDEVLVEVAAAEAQQAAAASLRLTLVPGLVGDALRSVAALPAELRADVEALLTEHQLTDLQDAFGCVQRPGAAAIELDMLEVVVEALGCRALVREQLELIAEMGSTAAAFARHRHRREWRATAATAVADVQRTGGWCSFTTTKRKWPEARWFLWW